jgi:Domain of unknown function (DUF1877)
MSMVAYFISVDEGELEELMADDSKLEAYISPEDSSNPESDLTYLDKAWHGISFLLSGEEWPSEADPPKNAICGGKEFGPDLGYGSPRFFSASEAVLIANGLELVTEEGLKERYDPQKMMDENIYPNTWDRDIEGSEEYEEEESEFEYLTDFFHPLRTFYLSVRDRKRAVITWIG